MMIRVLLFILFINSSLSHSQYRKNDGNRIGISAGITYTDVYTSNFNTRPELGWIAGLSVRGNFYNDKWSLIYGMQFTDSNFSIESINSNFQEEKVTYKLSGAQLRILGSYHLVEDYLALDFGPVLQLNGKLKVNDAQNLNVINDQGLKAEDITDISKVNGNLYLGLSGGGKRLRANLFYQLGLTNIMGNLNDNQDLKNLNQGGSFNAHMGLISGQVLINL
ncbi:PorT family protein [Flavobacterium oreochromis]|uniref:Outer membrane protein beta-barrel domain-containing protein n=1 Tax=Flavobacterium columnare TaxID=996 RepID=A0A246G8D4_9FLAO|nr:PorT family protein [Flavobacterium oreochromis]OWP75168.1 hypothetical protein BWK62_12570 [Flavobacterium oreochromis]